jgi:hypothetical protein
MNKKFTIIICLFLFVFVINFMIIDYFLIKFFLQNQNFFITKTSDQDIIEIPTKNNLINSQFDNKIIGNNDIFLSSIQEATASITQKILILENKVNSIISTPKEIKKSTNQVKEFYIPLGNGTSSSSEWSDLIGVESYLAPSNYGKIKSMYFETSLKIPTGNGQIYARLKNVTDNIGLYESEVFRDGGAVGFVSSGSIPIPQTTKLYRVQIKSTLGSEALIENARIKIFIE